jgi:hypothetical protein
MHAKRCYRFCDSKIVSIYFLDAGRNKRLYVNPLRGRTGRMLHRNNFGRRRSALAINARGPVGASRPGRHFGSRTRQIANAMQCMADRYFRFRSDGNLIG